MTHGEGRREEREPIWSNRMIYKFVFRDQIGDTPTDFSEGCRDSIEFLCRHCSKWVEWSFVAYVIPRQEESADDYRQTGMTTEWGNVWDANLLGHLADVGMEMYL